MKKHIFIASCLVAGLALSACNDTAAPVSGSGITSLTGVVAKGPINGGTVTVVDANGTVFTGITDANGAYNVNTNGGIAPFTVTISGGIDTITGQAPDLPLKAVVTKPAVPGSVSAPVNMFTTVVTSAAQAAIAANPGTTLTAALKTQTTNIVKNLGMGIPAGVDPTSDTTAANAAVIASANEALAEVVRRTTLTQNGATTAQDTIASIAADVSDGAFDGAAAPAAIQAAATATGATPTNVTNNITLVAATTASQAASVIVESSKNGGSVNVTPLTVNAAGTTVAGTTVPAATVASTLQTNIAAATTTVTGAPATVVLAAPAPTVVSNQTQAATTVATSASKTAVTNAATAITAANAANATTAQIAAAQKAAAIAAAAAQAAKNTATVNSTAVAADPTATVTQKTAATQTVTATQTAATQATAASTSAAAGNLTAAATAVTAASTAVTAAVTLTQPAPAVLKAFVLSGNSLSFSGQTPSTVDAYGLVATPAAPMAGTNIVLSGTLRDLTGLGVRTINTTFTFDVQQTLPATALRTVHASINPVVINVNAAGDVAVSVPVGATINYNYTNAAGTNFVGTASNAAANNNIIITTNAGVFTINASNLATIITNKTNAGMNILATVGTFKYAAGFAGVDMGHDNAANGVDSLYAVDTLTGTRALHGTFSTK